jgi:3-oxoacyl-[acyl-carrier-protein] synthase-3
MSTRYAQIVSTGRYIPDRVVTNEQLDELLGEKVGDWLVANVGIERRHVMAENQTTSDMIVAASQQALERAGLAASALDLILVATDTPDHLSPATASVVQARLGATFAGTFDVNCACAAWVTALDMAARYVTTDSDYRHVLVAGGYAMTRFLDWKDKYTATLFADGAGVALVSAGDRPGHLSGKLVAAGEYHDALGIYSGGAARPATPERVQAEGKPVVRFVRKFPATFNSERWPPLVRAAVAKAGLALDDISHFYFTQLNRRTIEAVMDILGQPMSKSHMIMDKWGYLGSACIPAALDDALERGLGPRAGDNVLFCASGGGLAMAASVWRWTAGPGQ